MSTIDKALETQLKNIQQRTGKTLDDLFGIIRKSGLTKHGQIRDMLKSDLSMGHGDANTLAHVYFKSAEETSGKSSDTGAADVLTEIYSGAKADLRPIHEKLMSAVHEFGPF